MEGAELGDRPIAQLPYNLELLDLAYPMACTLSEIGSPDPSASCIPGSPFANCATSTRFQNQAPHTKDSGFRQLSRHPDSLVEASYNNANRIIIKPACAV